MIHGYMCYCDTVDSWIRGYKGYCHMVDSWIRGYKGYCNATQGYVSQRDAWNTVILYCDMFYIGLRL